MVGDILQPTHLLFVLLVALLVLGPKRLPEVGRTLGSGLRDFRQAISGESDHDRYEQRHEPEPVEQRHQPAVEPEPLEPSEPAESAEPAEFEYVGTETETEPNPPPAETDLEPVTEAAPGITHAPVTTIEPAPEPATIQPLTIGASSAHSSAPTAGARTEPDA